MYHLLSNTNVISHIIPRSKKRGKGEKKIGLICNTTSAATPPRNWNQIIIITRPTAFKMLFNSIITIMLFPSILYLILLHGQQEHNTNEYISYPLFISLYSYTVKMIKWMLRARSSSFSAHEN